MAHTISPGEMYNTDFERVDHFALVEFTLNERNKGGGFIYGRVTIRINENGTLGFRPLASVKQVLKSVKKKKWNRYFSLVFFKNNSIKYKILPG